MALQVQRSTQPDGRRRLELSGAIDDMASFEGVFGGPPGPAVVDLRGIDRINSMGINRWVPAFQAFTSKSPVSVEAVPYCMVMQANCINNLFGAASVGSCLAPYFCGRCNKSESVLVLDNEVVSAGHQSPQKSCGSCGAAMDLDELESYFDFMRRSER